MRKTPESLGGNDGDANRSNVIMRGGRTEASINTEGRCIRNSNTFTKTHYEKNTILRKKK